MLASVGAYSLNRSMLDLVLLYAVGAVGCAMRVYDVPLVPAVLGLILGPLSEQQFRRALAISEGDLSVFVTRPICATLLVLACAVLAGPYLLRRWLPERGGDMSDRVYDVAVLGGGNAGLCAALTAREAGASVIVLECAPRHFRGGNSRHTRNLRCAHAAPTGVLTDTYPEDEFLADLLRVTGDETDEALARLVVQSLGRLPRRGCGGTACGSSRRSAARCTWRAPTRSSSAAARR